ncbi:MULTISPECIES: hypothetical protein [unclassified Ornithinimicrobium]|uniref:hypothetical protein n=1 Tax=unclassified Ornithinimicrobium TaxID=2615080 RepID=UPI003854A433
MPRTRRIVTALALVGATTVAAVVGARWVADELGAPVCVVAAGGSQESLTPEQMANAATIAALSVQRGLPPRAATIALATAIQESKLRNLTYGDADSQGLFQQRPSQGWGTEAQVTDPVYATHAFYDALVEVEGWETGVVTEVAQAVQRSAFPDAYADHEAEARVLASVLTGQEGSSTTMGCDLDPPTQPGSAEELATKVSEQLGVEASVDAATGHLTVPVPDDARAWSVATWAVAHADAEQVVGVTVAERGWQRGSSSPEWVPADAPSAAGTVVIELQH